MRVIFMGTPDFSVGTLEEIIKAGHEVVLVVSQPDKAVGRSKALKYTPVKECAIAHGIEVYQPERVRDSACIEYLKSFHADIMIVVAFGQIIPKAVLDMPKYGCVNVHASLLPKYRGAAPIQWAVINGEKVSGVTTMRMDEGLDTGDMLLKTVVPLDEKETGGSLFDKLSKAGADLLLETLDALENGTVTPQKQGESPTAYAKMLTKDMGAIDWNRPAKELERLIRGLNPWPSAYTKLNGKTLKIWAADVCGQTGEKAQPGTVLKAEKDEFLIQTGEKILSVKELQLEGKKRMDTAAFLRGCHLEKGMIL